MAVTLGQSSQFSIRTLLKLSELAQVEKLVILPRAPAQVVKLTTWLPELEWFKRITPDNSLAAGLTAYLWPTSLSLGAGDPDRVASGWLNLPSTWLLHNSSTVLLADSGARLAPHLALIKHITPILAIKRGQLSITTRLRKSSPIALYDAGFFFPQITLPQAFAGSLRSSRPAIATVKLPQGRRALLQSASVSPKYWQTAKFMLNAQTVGGLAAAKPQTRGIIAKSTFPDSRANHIIEYGAEASMLSAASHRSNRFFRFKQRRFKHGMMLKLSRKCGDVRSLERGQALQQTYSSARRLANSSPLNQASSSLSTLVGVRTITRIGALAVTATAPDPTGLRIAFHQPYVQYRPGLSSAWRQHRYAYWATVLSPRMLPYQHRITTAITRLRRTIGFSYLRMLELSIGQLSACCWSVTFANFERFNTCWSLNGSWVNNPLTQVYVGDIFAPARGLAINARAVVPHQQLAFRKLKHGHLLEAGRPCYMHVSDRACLASLIIEPHRWAQLRIPTFATLPYLSHRAYNWKYTT